MPRNPLNPRLPPKNSETGRRNKKRSKTKHPEISERMRARWQDPAFREKMKARDAFIAEDKKRYPGKYTRLGVPDGMTKKQVAPLWTRAYELADKFIQIMKDTGQLPTATHEKVEVVTEEGVTTIAVPVSDAGKAEEALREAFVMAIGPTDQKIKIQAINTILAYTKSKPESKSKLTIDKAEDFLDLVAHDLSK